MTTKWIYAALTVLAIMPAAHANNLNVNAGILPITPLAPYAHVFNHDASSFTDTVDFYLSTSTLDSSVNALNVSLQNLSVLNIHDLSYTVWGGSAGNDVTAYGTYAGTNTSYSLTGLMPGNYHLNISGVADGSGGGAYGLAMAASVPEPESVGMLLVGLGLLGIVQRRRSARKDAK
ncbi:FxDxF family PEP-CTERM protein [Duganella qianjiadongensis]|uniref:PEP-CTERM sorting domain-containing protein n=1 Tax=Duganella qianjiadongensis TaxID=2692176 RepID=A0ABW9VFW1_9BURK|nr:FxDxF family PEP-CTERM protein [Duganella qianjiadongensis]MYM38396.1 PEP-CTERM sorting domain-containing protein [Duganella qianjiadongensis]